jgi:hypothetical protein
LPFKHEDVRLSSACGVDGHRQGFAIGRKLDFLGVRDQRGASVSQSQPSASKKLTVPTGSGSSIDSPDKIGIFDSQLTVRAKNPGEPRPGPGRRPSKLGASRVGRCFRFFFAFLLVYPELRWAARTSRTPLSLCLSRAYKNLYFY